MSRQGSFVPAATEANWNVPVSVFDLFSIGIGPSSSHTVGPMRAQAVLSLHWTAKIFLPAHTGSLGTVRLAGRDGPRTRQLQRRAVGAGGEDPETVDTSSGPVRADEIRRTGELRLNGTHPVAFDPENDLILYRRRSLPFHPNGMTFTAYYDGKVL